MCEQGRYHGAKANFCSSTNPGVSGGLLRANCASAHNLQVILLIDRSTLWQEFMMHHAPAIEENCKQNLHIRPNLARFFRSWRARESKVASPYATVNIRIASAHFFT